MKNQELKRVVPTVKIGKSESYQYRGETNCYPFFNMVSGLVVKDYNTSLGLLKEIISYSK